VRSALIELQREPGWMRDYLRAYRVVIDEEVVGELMPGESHAFEVDPGAHRLYLTIDWCRSEKVTAELKPGETAAFRCEPNGKPFTELYWVSFGRHRYISLSELGADGELRERSADRRSLLGRLWSPRAAAVWAVAVIVAMPLLILRITDVLGPWASLVASGIVVVLGLLGYRAETKQAHR